ncbi:MAG: hypothetical protein K8W52_35490 [Deltaproteobacteria bacterium]|nr:hypothetical protein [Deltaproteobacteria bacterium]
MRRLIGTILAVGTSVGLTACSLKSEGAPSQVASARDAAPADTVVLDSALAAATESFADVRDRVVAALDTHLAELDAKIATLKIDLAARVGSAQTAVSAAGKNTMNNAVAALERQREDARAALDLARRSTADHWNDVQRVASDTVIRVQDAYDAAVAALRR